MPPYGAGPDLQCTHNSREILPNPRPPLFKETAHRRLGLQQDCLRIGCIGARMPTEASQQIGAPPSKADTRPSVGPARVRRAPPARPPAPPSGPAPPRD